MEASKIQWTDNTFNPWIGCTKVSAGCKFCYAEADMDKRRKRVTWGVNGTRSVTSYVYWRKPLLWNLAAQAQNKQIKVFCASLADVFEKWDGQLVDSKGQTLTWDDRHDVDGIPCYHVGASKYDGNTILTLDIMRAELFKLIERTPYLIWQLLTKRPENVMGMIPEHWREKFPSNVWIGTSVEDQEQADIRIPHLIKIPADVRFLSCEPLLGAIEFSDVTNRADATSLLGKPALAGIDWVIAGGESGRDARPMHPDWLRSMRDQCRAADVPFLFKQWGEWGEGARGKDFTSNKCIMVGYSGRIYRGTIPSGDNTYLMSKVGKSISGRMLDGKEYSQFPNK